MGRDNEISKLDISLDRSRDLDLVARLRSRHKTYVILRLSLGAKYVKKPLLLNLDTRPQGLRFEYWKSFTSEACREDFI